MASAGGGMMGLRTWELNVSLLTSRKRQVLAMLRNNIQVAKKFGGGCLFKHECVGISQ